MGLMDKIREDFTQEKTFEVELTNGMVFTFRSPTDAEAVQAIRNKGERFWKMTQNAGKANPAFKPFLPISLETAQKIAFIRELNTGEELTHTDLLELARDFGPVFLALNNAIMNKIGYVVAEVEVEEIDLAKKE